MLAETHPSCNVLSRRTLISYMAPKITQAICALKDNHLFQNLAGNFLATSLCDYSAIIVIVSAGLWHIGCGALGSALVTFVIQPFICPLELGDEVCYEEMGNICLPVRRLVEGTKETINITQTTITDVNGELSK
eukprot:Pgem_evm1s1159